MYVCHIKKGQIFFTELQLQQNLFWLKFNLIQKYHFLHFPHCLSRRIEKEYIAESKDIQVKKKQMCGQTK